jgi:KDO2-lipid IV(A) lauroyltransferase
MKQDGFYNSPFDIQIFENTLKICQYKASGHFYKNCLSNSGDIRGRFGAEPVEKRTAFRTIVRHTKQICITAMVADQHSHNPRQSLSADFFGKPANFYTGPERIARKLGQPMLFVAMKRRSRGFYSIRFHLVDEPPFCSDENAMIYRYIDLIEQTVREQPEAYLWSHNRWKARKKQVPETPA